MGWACTVFGHTWARLDPPRGMASPKMCLVCGKEWALRPWPPPPPPPVRASEPLTVLVQTRAPDGSVRVRSEVIQAMPPAAEFGEEAARRGVLL